MWQKSFEKYQDQGFTVVGIAMDVEGIAPARKYYEQFDVTFPALVDPNYATRFGVVPVTLFVNEHGVVQPLKDWELRLRSIEQLDPVTAEDRGRFSVPHERLEPGGIATLAETVRAEPSNLAAVVELASRYLDLELKKEATQILRAAVSGYDARQVARGDEIDQQRLLADAYLQLSRATNDQQERISSATLSYFLNPSIGFAKQISRIIAPDRFDDRPDGSFDNDFREATRRRLEQERVRWLQTAGDL